MRILVLYTLRKKKVRKTIQEHLYSFKHYRLEDDIIYVNVGSSGIPAYLQTIKFDIVIFHYTLLAAERFIIGNGWDRKMKGMEKISGFKIAIPQDEYCYTNRLIQFFKQVDIDIICTCFYKEKDIDFAYRKYLSEKVKYILVFTGYVDENESKRLDVFLTPYAERVIDIGYRASMLPAYLGRHGQLKYQLIDIFKKRLVGKNLKIDIESSNQELTKEDKQLVKLGDSWSTFLLNCKAFIGCEGGSSLLDLDGSIQKKVEQFTSLNPTATFDEIERNCFLGKDYNISCFAISPRHFEAAMTKTLQILVEGYYGGVFKPWVHYIPLKKDYSNFFEIITFLENDEKCQLIIDTAHQDIVQSGKYTYKLFVEQVFQYCKFEKINTVQRKTEKEKIILKLIELREGAINLLISIGWYNFNLYNQLGKIYKNTLQHFVPIGIENQIKSFIR